MEINEGLKLDGSLSPVKYEEESDQEEVDDKFVRRNGLFSITGNFNHKVYTRG